ncbi:hypothetical protein DICVIV_09987 [Dictyocaulus viviparus]|uniref:SAM domain-containing protein n=1 Tax=Dictyocaulus viviparus TaxID=29172 RepID=A0A0D8XJI6_DICVI|nr:hypothetical protein DICVIV_09987 [Dictyocaulus viviparus]
MNETEKNFKNDVDHTNSSLHDMAIQKRIRSQANEASEKSHLSTLQEYHSDNQNEEMKRLRHAIQRLIADNELKNHQINSLRNALNEQLRSRSHQEDFSKMSQCSDDLNSQIRRLLSEEPYQPMTHSSSYPVRLCSSSYNRMAVQPSSSYTSSLSAAAVYQRCPKSGNRRLYPSITGSCSEHSYRSPPSPAARQLAAELDELRLTDRKSSQNKMYSSVSLSRGLDNKALSTLALPMKKHSLSSVISAVESDDEIVRGGTHHAVSPHVILEKPSKRGRTGSSIRNLLNKLTRSISQEQNTSTSKTGSAIRSTQFAQVTEKFRKVELFPSRSHFNEWRLEQLTEWMKKAGLVQYVAELAKYSVLGIKRALLRKRLNVLLRRIENEIKDSAATWDVQETQKWLDDIGLPQYKEVFLENMIDGVMIVELTATDLAEAALDSLMSKQIFLLLVNQF